VDRVLLWRRWLIAGPDTMGSFCILSEAIIRKLEQKQTKGTRFGNPQMAQISQNPKRATPNPKPAVRSRTLNWRASACPIHSLTHFLSLAAFYHLVSGLKWYPVPFPALFSFPDRIVSKREFPATSWRDELHKSLIVSARLHKKPQRRKGAELSALPM
jgi:hypothetical protein